MIPDLSTVEGYKEMIPDVLRSKQSRLRQPYLVVFTMSGACFATLRPRLAPKIESDLRLIEDEPMFDYGLFTKAARELEEEGVLVAYPTLNRSSQGVTLEYAVGLPERRQELTLMAEPRAA